METKEILDKGVNYTFNDYYQKSNDDNIDTLSRIHSTIILANIVKNKSKAFKEYDMDVELKNYLKKLNKDDIKKELLKNVANNAILMKENISNNARKNDTKIRPGMDVDDYSLVVYNNMLKYGINKGYNMLKNYSILFGACELYVRNRINNRASFFESVATITDEGIFINNAIDEYFNCKTKNEKVKTLIKK